MGQKIKGRIGNLGNKETMAKNIQRFLDMYGLNPHQFSEIMGFKYTTVMNWIKANSYPRIDKIELMARYFGVDKSDLVEEYSKTSSTLSEINNVSSKLEKPRQEKVLDFATDELEEQQKLEKQKNIINLYKNEEEYIDDVVTGLVSAGSGVWQYDNINEEVRFPKSAVPERYDTIAKVHGHSMEPVIHDKDFLFIRVASQIDFNQIGIFQVNGENYVKKQKRDEFGVPYLESLNYKYDDIYLFENDEIRTIGEVVGIYNFK